MICLICGYPGVAEAAGRYGCPDCLGGTITTGGLSQLLSHDRLCDRLQPAPHKGCSGAPDRLPGQTGANRGKPG